MGCWDPVCQCAVCLDAGVIVSLCVGACVSRLQGSVYASVLVFVCLVSVWVRVGACAVTCVSYVRAFTCVGG